jgi:hypothetical protein
VQPSEVPDLAGDRYPVELRRWQAAEAADAVGQQEQPDPRRVGEGLLDGLAHVVQVRGLLDVLAQSVTAAAQEVGHPLEQGLRFCPAHPLFERMLPEVGDEQVECLHCLVGPVAVDLHPVAVVVGGEGVLGDAGLFQVVQYPPGEDEGGGG